MVLGFLGVADVDFLWTSRCGEVAWGLGEVSGGH